MSVIVLVVVGLVAASTIAASAAPVPLSDWTPKFCSAVTDYENTLSTQGNSLTSSLEGVSDLATARQQTAAFLGDMRTAATTAKAEIQAAGTPAIPNGAKIVRTFAAGLDASAKLFAKAQAQAKRLPTTSVHAYQVKGKQLGENLTKASGVLTKQFGGVRKLDTGKQLQTAVKATPECASIA